MPFGRRELTDEVVKSCAWWDIREGAEADVDTIGGRVLSAQEREQRGVLLKIAESDGHFLRRGVTPRITVLERVKFSDDELCHLPHLSDNKALLDAVAHLDECGSLLQVSSLDLDDIERDLAQLSKGTSFFVSMVAARKLARLREELAPLVARYDVVVANPLCMGSSGMGRWLTGWVRKHYPDSKGDWRTCLISRGARFADVWAV